jgi:quinolinate synthase
MSDEDIINDIKRLKKELNAVILAHYYQDDDIQEIADFIGDSYALSKQAKATDADVIVFCGVKFMAETAKILNPQKLVLLPDLEAGCSLEQSCRPADFAAFRAKYPEHIAITYINCSAEIKALSDIICTSSNAEKIIRSIPPEQGIIFAPDKHLGGYLEKITGRKMVLWDGVCIVHDTFNEKELVKLTIRNPNAVVIAHPECPENLLKYATHIGSTSSLIDYVANAPSNEFIVLTEPGVFYEMKKRRPGVILHSVSGLERHQIACVNCNNCPFMRLNTLEKIYLCMKNQAPQITLDENLRLKAAKALENMLRIAQ